MYRKKDDILLKSAFEETFPDLLRFYYKNADGIFDMDRGFEFMDKELRELFPELDKSGGTRFVDMLVKSFLKDGEEEWIFIHIEIQGGDSKNFARRMFQYWYRIYDRFQVDVAAIAVFTGDKSQKRPDMFQKEFLDTSITYRFKAYHILDHSEEELLSMDNPFALIVLAAQKALTRGKIPEEELGEQRLTVARALIQGRKYSHEQIMRFLYFLKNFIYIENQEINRNFDSEITFLTGKENQMGIIETIKKIAREEALEEGLELGMEKGIEKGAEQKSREFVRNLLQNTDFDNAKIASLSGVTTAFVEKVKKESNG
jgi:hypothetical protein